MDAVEKRIYTTFLMAVISLIALFIAAGWLLVKRYRREKERRSRHYLSEMELLEDERRRISADLHDEVGAGLSITYNMLVEMEGKDDLETTMIQKSAGNIEKVNKRLGEIARNLRASSLLKNGLQQALEEVLEQVKASGRMKYRLQYKVKSPLPEQVRMHVFRMMQEIIANAVKHSQASFMEVEVKEIRQTLYIRSRDNGIGFDEEQVREKGSGLHNMEYRAALLNGKVFREPNAGDGVSYRIEIPLINQL